MSSIVPGNIPASIEVTLDQPELFVGFTVFDDSGVSPVQVTGQGGQINNLYPALNYSGNSYRIKFQGDNSKWYLIRIAVYTDDTYMTVDVDEPQGSDSIYFQAPPSNSNSGQVSDLIGFVDDCAEVFGVVEDSDEIFGEVKC